MTSSTTPLKTKGLGGGFTVFYKFSLRGFKPLTN
jgi:hypothetical protein